MINPLKYNLPFLNNFGIRLKLVILVIIPMSLMVLLAGIYIYENYTKKYEYEKLDTIMKLSSSVSLLIHETQKERGMTAGFLGSKGAKFGDKLTDQRKLTDQKLGDFKSFYSNMDKGNA